MSTASLAGLQVIITRSLPHASTLQQEINKQQGISIILPTLEIIPIPHALSNLNKYDLLIFTSRNAVENVSSKIWGHKAKIAAIGPSTARALESKGVFVDFIPAEGFSSENLLKIPFFKDVKNRNILIIAGEGGRNLLQTILVEKKASVTKIAVYRRVCPLPNKATINVINKTSARIFISMSCESLQNLVDIMAGFDLQNWLYHSVLLVVSERIKQFAIEQGFKNIVMAKNPTDQAILECLIKWYSSTPALSSFI